MGLPRRFCDYLPVTPDESVAAAFPGHVFSLVRTLFSMTLEPVSYRTRCIAAVLTEAGFGKRCFESGSSFFQSGESFFFTNLEISSLHSILHFCYSVSWDTRRCHGISLLPYDCSYYPSASGEPLSRCNHLPSWGEIEMDAGRGVQ